MFFLGWTEPRNALLQTTLTPLMPSTAPNQATAFSIFPISNHWAEQSNWKSSFTEGIKGEVAAAGPLVATVSPVIAHWIWMDFTFDSRKPLPSQNALALFSSSSPLLLGLRCFQDVFTPPSLVQKAEIWWYVEGAAARYRIGLEANRSFFYLW